jgi:hypothetical protein
MQYLVKNLSELTRSSEFQKAKWELTESQI